MASVTGQEKADASGIGSQSTTTTLVHEKQSAGSLPSLDTHATLGKTMSNVPRTSDLSASSTQNGNPFDTDVEAMVSMPSHDLSATTKSSLKCKRAGTDCQVWPGQDHWQRKAQAAKMQRRSCNCLARLSKRNRIIVKILIGVLFIGIAVGVGFGVSKPLGAAIWHSNNPSNN